MARLLSLFVVASLLVRSDANSQVQVAWTATYDGDNLEGQYDYDYVTSMAVDGAARLHVTGNVYGSNGTPNIVTIQYGSDGQPNWIATYDGARNQDYAAALTLDESGNVYVAGDSATFAGGNDLVVLKYDSNGHLLWVARYNGPGNTSDTAEAVRVDKAGNVYVTGYSYNAQGNFDAVTIKYDSQGRELWVARYDGPGHDEDRGQGLVLDAEGNVYVTGFATTDCFLDPTGDISCRYAGLTIKYSPAGEQLWVDLYGETNEFRNLFNSIAVDSAGEPVVTGMSLLSIGGFETVTIKYTAQGRREWVAREPDGFGLGGGWKVATDPGGNVVVLGRGTQIYKYDSRGQTLWVDSGQPQVLGEDLAVDEAGGVYITGTAWNDIGLHADVVAARYDSLGNPLWSYRYSNGTNTYDASSALAVDDDGNVYIGGQTETSGVFGRDFLVIKLTQEDNLPPPVVSFRTDRSKAFEGHRNPPGRFTIMRTGETTAPLIVNYAVGGTADNGADYERLAGTVAIPAGQSEASILVQPRDDRIREGSEFVRLSLLPGSDYRLGDPQHATVTIVDDDRK
jgi:hypothetical protein